MVYQTVSSLCMPWIGLMDLPGSSSRTARTPVVGSQAATLLRKMSEYINSLGQFTFHVENTFDEVLSSNHKIQFGSTASVFVRRPDRYRADITGDFNNQKIFYDGKKVTLLDTDLNYYATLDAPQNIDAALNQVLESFSLKPPLSDLLYNNTYDILMKDVKCGFHVGLHEIRGTECHHLAFRQHDIDWQIWVDNGNAPLPRKIIITQKNIAGAPQFTGLLSDWNVSSRFQDGFFSFSAPDNAQKIEFLPVDKTAAS